MNEEPIVWAFWGHEPRSFYKRRDGNAKTFFGNGEWVDAWYERLHTEEAIARLASMGVNLIYTHFYKSMGLEFERPEMGETERLVGIAHKYGIRVLGYATLNSVYVESLAYELPDIEEMVVQRHNGEQSDKYRDYLCLNSRYYTEYFPRVVECGLGIGLDGFHFDNAISPVCYCPRCLKGFRKYLAENISDPRSVGLPGFEHVRLPVIPICRGIDGISIMALRYYRALYEQVYGGISRYVKKLSDGKGIVLINSGFADQRLTPAQTGYEIGMDSDSDLIFIETPDEFIGRVQDGRLKNAVFAYKLADMKGKKALNTMWKKFGLAPDTPPEIRRVVAEGMAFGGIAGTNWAARAVKKGSGMIFDAPMQFETLQNYFEYFKKHPALYVGAKAVCNVGILYLPDARLAGETKYERVLHLVAESLAENAVPYSILMTGASSGSVPENLIVPDAEYLADEEIATIEKWRAERGIRLLFVGAPGVYHPCGMEREKKPFQNEFVFPLPESEQKSEDVFKDRLANAIFPPFRLNRKGLLAETRETLDGRKVLHILNPENENAIRNLEIEFRNSSDRKIEIVSPDGDSPYAWKNGRLAIERLDTLCTLVFERESSIFNKG